MIVLIGESASGKSTLQNLLVKEMPNLKKLVSYTTRPIREGEVDGVDYHFIPEATFDVFVKQGFFAEHTEYNGWKYGTAKVDCQSENTVAILTPSGFRKMQRLGINTTSIYLYVDRRTRLINILKRGDDIEEAYRRSLSDVGQFDGIIDEVDYIIDNTKMHMNEQQVLKCLLEILNTPEGIKHMA